MKRLQGFSRVSLVLLVAVTLTASLLATSFRPLYAQQAGQGLEISPPLLELNVNPGQTTTFEIHLRNITKGPLITKGSIDDFIAEGEEGQAKLLIDKNAEPSPYSFKTWAQPIADLSVAPQELKTAQITLQVPKDASPGGHYGVVRFSGVAPELEGTGVSLSASIGTLVLINVSGDVKKKASLEEFATEQHGKKKGFFENGPITFVERIRNQGTVHVKPVGTIRVTNMFGKETQVFTVNDKGGNILPNSVRRFEQQLGKKNLFGKYTVEANIQYEGQNISGKISFWVIPYRLLALVLGGLIVLAVFLRLAIKRYNRYIVAKATKSKSKDKE
jgi:hypothetical protein